MAKRIVGKVSGDGTVKFKDMAAYRANYAKNYFFDEWGTRPESKAVRG
jgi:hypothetical protein